MDFPGSRKELLLPQPTAVLTFRKIRDVTPRNGNSLRLSRAQCTRAGRNPHVVPTVSPRPPLFRRFHFGVRVSPPPCSSLIIPYQHPVRPCRLMREPSRELASCLRLSQTGVRRPECDSDGVDGRQGLTGSS